MSLSKKRNTHTSDRVIIFYVLGAMVICALAAIGSFFYDNTHHAGAPLYIVVALVGGMAVAGFLLGAMLIGMVLPSKIAEAIKARGNKSESTG